MRYRRQAFGGGLGADLSVPNLSPIATTLQAAAEQEAAQRGRAAGFAGKEAAGGLIFNQHHYAGAVAATRLRAGNDLNAAWNHSMGVASKPGMGATALAKFDSAKQKILATIGDAESRAITESMGVEYRSRISRRTYELNVARTKREEDLEKGEAILSASRQSLANDGSDIETIWSGLDINDIENQKLMATSLWTAMGLGAQGQGMPKLFGAQAVEMARKDVSNGVSEGEGIAAISAKIDGFKKHWGGVFTEEHGKYVLDAYIGEYLPKNMGLQMWKMENEGRRVMK